MKSRFSSVVVFSFLVLSGGWFRATFATPEIVLESAREAAAQIQSADLACEFHVQAAIAAARAGQTADSRRDFAAAWRFWGAVPAEARRPLLFGILDGYLQCEYNGEVLARVQLLGPLDRVAAMLFVTSDARRWPADATDNLLDSLSGENDDAPAAARIRQVIARMYVDKGCINEAVRLVNASLAADSARRIDEADKLLLELVGRSAQQQNYDGARRLALHTTNTAYRDAALVQVVGAAVDHGAADEAWNTLQGIRPGPHRDLASFQVITMVATRGRLSTAKALLAEVKENSVRCRAYEAIAVAYARRGCVQEATRALQKAIHRSPDIVQTDDAHHRVAVAFAESGSIQAAETYLANVASPEAHSSIHAAIAVGYSRLGWTCRAGVAFGKAATSLDLVADPIVRATLLRELATSAINHGQHDAGRAILMRARQEGIRAALHAGGDVMELCEIGSLLARNFGIDSAQPVFETAARSAELYRDGAYVARLFQQIARYRAEVGDVNGVINWGIGQQDAVRRAFILVGVAQGLNNAAIEPRRDSPATTRCLPKRYDWRRRFGRTLPKDATNGRLTERCR